MKKIISIVLVVYVLGFPLKAQDTLTVSTDKYLFIDKPNLCYFSGNQGYHGIGYNRILYNRVNVSGITKVYGIAVTLESSNSMPLDTYTTEHRIVATLFKANDSAITYMDTTSCIYAQNYFVYEFWYSGDEGVLTQLDSATYYTVPIYEYYFDSAITVYDTFNIGVMDSNTPDYAGILQPLAVISEEWSPQAYYWLWDFTSHRNFHAPHGNLVASWGGIFPIIKPLTDTADSNGVQLVAATNSVCVEPNPAHGTVNVRAAEGLRRVEFFDMTGLRAMSREASGPEAHIDIATLPAGIYVVRVHTTTGIVSRKLVVF